MKIGRENPNLVKTGQKCGTHYMKTSARFIVTSNIKLPQSATFDGNGTKLSARTSVCQSIFPKLSAQLPLNGFS